MLDKLKIACEMFLIMDKAYVDYKFFQQITENGAFYVTKMKKDICYKQLEDTYGVNSNGLVVLKENNVEFDNSKTCTLPVK